MPLVIYGLYDMMFYGFFLPFGFGGRAISWLVKRFVLPLETAVCRVSGLHLVEV